MAIGKRIKFFRNRKGRTQKQLGEILGFLGKTSDRSDIDTYIGLMHTFFALEDIYGLKIDKIDGEVCLYLDKSSYSSYSSINKMLTAWQLEAAKLENDEISKEEYDEWRYKYPKLDTHQIWAKVIPTQISDMPTKELAKEEKEQKSSKRKKKN